MKRRAWLPISAMLLAPCLAAAPVDAAGEEVHALIEGMHTALMDGKPDALRAFFDPAMPGFKALSNDIGALLRESLAPSSVEFLSNTGDDHARDLELDWRLQIESDSGQSSVDRRARVKLRAEKRDGRWRIVSFAPLDFFAPAGNGAIWDLISNSLGALSAVSGDPNPDDSRVPARFLSAFDPRMPGYEQLRANVIGLLSQGNVDSSLELVSSQGDDRRRTLELDWTLSLVRPESGIGVLQRHQVVKCQVERQGGKWRIVAFEPLDFLAPEKLR
jgi:hypothetical protein